VGAGMDAAMQGPLRAARLQTRVVQQ